MCVFLDKPAIVLTGGYEYDVKANTTSEVIGESEEKLTPLTEANYGHTMVITNNNELMTLGGDLDDRKQCYKLEKGSWQKQNPLTQPRQNAVG